MITQAINLNLIPGQVLPRVNVSQYDSGTRTLQMTLFNGEQIFNVPSGASGFIQGTKPDRTGFQYAATVTAGSNIVTIDITQQMTAVKGEVVCELVLANDDDRIATVNFIIYVEPAALADDTIISETELPLIEEAAELAQEIGPIVEQVEADANRAETAADNAELWASRNPYIGQNGNWFVFDTTTQAYVDTQIPAPGPQGPQGDDGPTGPQGPTGPTGATGNGITSITKTGTSGLVDTYTILFTDGTTTTFTVTNGQDGQGSGDMTKAVYDSTNAVADAGGIVAYVAAHSGAGTLAGLTDVALTTLTDGQSLIYDATSQKWVNGSVAYSSLSGKPTLGTAAAKDSTNAVTSGSTDLVESGAVYSANQTLTTQINKAYKSDDSAETTIDGADYIPFYDSSASAMKKILVSNAKFGGGALYFTGVACAATTGNFVDYSNSAITTDHVVAEISFANPSAITSDEIRWSTETAGKITINGTCASATTCSILLVEKDN